MTDDVETAPRSWLGLVVVVAVALAVDVFALARHSGFQPATTLRAAAPALALVLGAAFTHRVAARRAEIDVPGEFNPGSRALFLGFVMVAVTLLAWLLAAQALPSLLNSRVGMARTEVAVVSEKPAPTDDAACGHRLVVTSDSLPRPLDLCVAEDLWNRTAVGGKATVDLVAGALGAEALGVRR